MSVIAEKGKQIFKVLKGLCKSLDSGPIKKAFMINRYSIIKTIPSGEKVSPECSEFVRSVFDDKHLYVPTIQMSDALDEFMSGLEKENPSNELLDDGFHLIQTFNGALQMYGSLALMGSVSPKTQCEKMLREPNDLWLIDISKQSTENIKRGIKDSFPTYLIGHPFADRNVVVLLQSDEIGTSGVLLNGKYDKIDDLSNGGAYYRPLVIHKFSDVDSIELSDDLFLSFGYEQKHDTYQKAKKMPNPHDSRREFNGIFRWGPGQLEKELHLGLWFVMKGSSQFVFDSACLSTDPSDLWQKMLCYAGGEFREFSRLHGWKPNADESQMMMNYHNYGLRPNWRTE